MLVRQSCTQAPRCQREQQREQQRQQQQEQQQQEHQDQQQEQQQQQQRRPHQRHHAGAEFPLINVPVVIEVKSGKDLQEARLVAQCRGGGAAAAPAVDRHEPLPQRVQQLRVAHLRPRVRFRECVVH